MAKPGSDRDGAMVEKQAGKKVKHRIVFPCTVTVIMVVIIVILVKMGVMFTGMIVFVSLRLKLAVRIGNLLLGNQLALIGKANCYGR